jgi:hypothetical protein
MLIMLSEEVAEAEVASMKSLEEFDQLPLIPKRYVDGITNEEYDKKQ